MLRQTFLTISLLSAATILPAGTVFAQTGGTDCAVGKPGQGTTQGSGKAETDAPRAGSLTETLDDCNGVLTPPRVGDGEIVEPAPQTGNMPVITPKDVPKSGNSAQQP